LAMFLQYLTADLLEKKPLLHEKTAAYISRITDSEKYKKVALIDYGKEGLAGYSYTTGMVMFHLLYNLVGADAFNNIIKTYYLKYANTGATTTEFTTLVNDLTTLDLRPFFKDWIYSTHYIEVLAKQTSIKALTSYYRK